MNCCGGKGRPIMVVYMSIRTDIRRGFVACTYCDVVDSWPIYNRSAHGGV